MFIFMTVQVAIAAVNSAVAVIIVCRTSPTKNKYRTKKNKKKRTVQSVAAVENVVTHNSTVGAEEAVTCPISSSASTPEHTGCPGNSNEVAINCLLKLRRNVCRWSIEELSETTEQDEVTIRDGRQNVQTRCASSPVITCESECGETDVTPTPCNDFCFLVNAITDIFESVAGPSGSTNIAAKSDVAPAVSAIGVVPAASTGSQAVARNDIDQFALPHNEPAVQHDQEGRALLSEPSTSTSSQLSVSIDAPAPTLQSHGDRTRPPDESDDPRLGKFNGAGLTNRQYKVLVIKLLSENCPLPTPELIVTNRRLIRALPISTAARVKKWKRASSRRTEGRDNDAECLMGSAAT